MMAVWIIACRLWWDLFALIKFLFDGKTADAWAVSRGHQYFFKNFFKTARKRKKYSQKENKKGRYKKSIIWDYYMNKIHKFSQLHDNNFH